MTKKLLSAVLAFAMMTALLSGCSLFATDDGNGPQGGSTGGIKMTDSYTFNDPTDIQFEKRYVIYCDETSPMVSSGADYGMKATYDINYADADDAPVGSYSFIVVDTAEHAQAVIDLYASQGSTMTATAEDPCVLYSFTDGDAMEGTLLMYQSVGMITETTVSAYVEFYSGSVGGTVQ